MATHKNRPVDNKYITGKALLLCTKCSHCDEAVAPGLRCSKMSPGENVYKVTPMMFTLNHCPSLGGAGDCMEEGASVIDDSLMHLHLAIPNVIIPLLGSK